MAFVTRLAVAEKDSELGIWVLIENLNYVGKWDEFIVTAGTLTDFASVPKALWNVLPPYGKHTKAAVLHDYLYAEAPEVWAPKRRHRGMTKVRITRKDADGIFLRTMRELGVGWIRRHAMYRGVRLGGWVAWNAHRKRQRDGDL